MRKREGAGPVRKSRQLSRFGHLPIERPIEHRGPPDSTAAPHPSSRARRTRNRGAVACPWIAADRCRRRSARSWTLTGASQCLVRGLFSEILHRDLDAIVVHLLVFGLRLLTTLRAAMEELDHIRDWGTRRPIERIDPRRRSHIGQTVEIKVNHVVVQGTDIYASRRLIADTEHFCPVALRRNVSIAPPTILKPDAAGCRAAAFEPDALRPR